MQSKLVAESSGVRRPLTNIYNGKEIGGFKVICSGALVVPPNWCGSLFAWILIVGPSILQIIFVNSQFSQAVGIDIGYIITMLLSLTFLFLTTYTDPGIIPRFDPDEYRTQLRNVFLAVNEDIEIDHVAYVKDQEILCMKCRTCNIYRPPRSFHCSDC